MANLVHPSPQFGLRPAVVNHAPSLGFGFGLSSAPSLPGRQPSAMQAPAYSPSHSASGPAYTPNHGKQTHKRRYDNDDDDRDDSMDRSPTPEQRALKRIIQKRLRVLESSSNERNSGQDKSDGERKSAENEPDDDVDLGMLLGVAPHSDLRFFLMLYSASLPSESLLTILTSLISSHPNLKPAILSLIPRPALNAALSALDQAAKRLNDAYPYSNTSTHFPQQSATTSFGFGAGTFTSGRTNTDASSSSHHSGFGRHPTQSTGMRDSYVQSRLRQPIGNFCSTAFFYMPYFSYSSESSMTQAHSHGNEKAHPTEVFDFLTALTRHLTIFPPLVQSSLLPLISSRLLQEWLAWVNRVDQYVNTEAGMFGMEVVQSWAQTLDEFAGSKVGASNSNFVNDMKMIRDRWIAAVGWLIRRQVHRMYEEEL